MTVHMALQFFRRCKGFATKLAQIGLGTASVTVYQLVGGHADFKALFCRSPDDEITLVTCQLKLSSIWIDSNMRAIIMCHELVSILVDFAALFTRLLVNFMFESVVFLHLSYTKILPSQLTFILNIVVNIAVHSGSSHSTVFSS